MRRPTGEQGPERWPAGGPVATAPDAIESDATAPDATAPDNVPRPSMDLEALIGLVLRVGVLLSIATILGGTVVSLVHHGSELSSAAHLNELTQRRGAFPHTLDQIYRGVIHGQGAAIVMAGLLMLILTPVARLVVSGVVFAARRDTAFVLIVVLVLATVVVAFLVGWAGG